jgi:hypothetical protein
MTRNTDSSTLETEKSLREIAEEIAKRITDNPCAHPSCCPHTAKAADAIEKALRDRDERAAKIAEDDDFTHSSGYRCHRGKSIASAIRGKS